MDSIIAGISWFVFFLLHRVACEILVPWPGIKPAPPALEAWGLCHWMAREVQGFLYIFWNSAWHIVGAPQCWLKSSLLSYSAQTVMTEHPRLGRLNKQKLTSPSSGGWKSKIKVLATQVSSWGFSWLADGCLLTVSSYGKGRERWCLFFSFLLKKNFFIEI